MLISVSVNSLTAFLFLLLLGGVCRVTLLIGDTFFVLRSGCSPYAKKSFWQTYHLVAGSLSSIIFLSVSGVYFFSFHPLFLSKLLSFFLAVGGFFYGGLLVEDLNQKFLRGGGGSR